MINKSKRAQSILDFVLIFGILLFLLVWLTRIWIWFNANYAKRNVYYQVGDTLHEGQGGRFYAGTPDDTKQNRETYTNKTFTLNDDWVFNGRVDSNERVDALPNALEIPDGPDGGDPQASACANARSSAASMRSQASTLSLQAISIGGMYCPSKHGASCRARRSQAQGSLRAQAASLTAEANRIEASGCGG